MTAPILGNRKVLIVDDEPANLQLMKEILERDGCEIRLAESGDGALRCLGEWRAALVLLDQDMPGMTGLETLKAIKDRFADTDVMFVSAHSTPRMVSQALEQGADDYLKKPFAVIELISRIRVRFRIRDLREELRIANQKLEELSVTDDLTGLYNMRSMYERIDYELKRTHRTGRTLGCVMIDMDHFKNVNDGHDHLFGSFVIREMGDLLRKNLREVDFAARYGGDEFLIVLTEVDEQGVQIFCQRLLEAVRGYTFREGNYTIQLTLSAGYAIGRAAMGFDGRDMVRAADHALYQSKEKGRNQINGFNPEQTAEYIKIFKSQIAA